MTEDANRTGWVPDQARHLTGLWGLLWMRQKAMGVEGEGGLEQRDNLTGCSVGNRPQGQEWMWMFQQGVHQDNPDSDGYWWPGEGGSTRGRAVAAFYTTGSSNDLVYKALEKCRVEHTHRERLTDGPCSSVTKKRFQNHLAPYWVHSLPCPQPFLR